ncbi:MAG: recombinase family protein [Candidatus Methylophosphatis roskildensis]
MNKISAEHLARRACVYIRQSTPEQVHHNLESQRRQYALTERARALGWEEVEVIDEDLGCSGSGTHRRGFERLLGLLCDGQVGAVFSIEASRLARNGRDWHTLLEFCSLVGALLIDADGVYDPAHINDRLLLGMKGTISEMELASFRQRAQAAMAQKAKRGELYNQVPIGYVRTPDDRVEKEADQRVCAALDLVFRKFAELASVRQLYFWLQQQQIKLPAINGAGAARHIVWKQPRYHVLLSLLKNPIYAGTYAYGRSKTIVRIEHGRKRISRTRQLPCEDWAVLIPDHHEGYISWAVYQSNQAAIAHNASGVGAMVRGSVKRGSALLSGLLRCGHCGTKLVPRYPAPGVIRYQCAGRILDREASCCVMFGGLRADHMVAEQVLECLKPHAIDAAIEAIENLQGTSDERAHQKALALEQARYQVARAQRQYDAVDPTQRLVAAELERRWNEALTVQAQIEQELAALKAERPSRVAATTKEELLALAEDLPCLWDHPDSQPEFKKRILRTVLKEIIVTSEGKTIHLLLHWQGGDHTELQFEKGRPGVHRHVMDADTIELISCLARIQPDSMITSILNRIGRRTAHDQSWTAMRVCSIRNNHAIAVYREGERQSRGELSVAEVGALLRVTQTTVLRMIRQRRLPATQACSNAPWIVRQDDLDRFLAASSQANAPQTSNPNQLVLDIQ